MSTSPTPSPSSTSSLSTPAIQIAPLQQVTFKASDFSDDESLTLFNQQFTNIINQINNLLGFNGPIKFPNHVDMAGNRLMNVGAAVEPTDAVSQAYGNTQYGAAALKPYFEAIGKQIFQTYRRLSDRNQREQYSSFLNQVLNTAPTANTSYIFFGVPSAGTVETTITSGLHQRVDGSAFPYTGRTDTLALPEIYTITSISRTSGIVTVTTSAATGIVPGDGFTISSVSDPTYDGTFVALTVAGTTITYYQGGPNSSSGGGALSVNGVYYYTISHGQSNLGLVSGFSADTWSNRREASYDGTTIIGVVVITNNGGDPVNSAAGNTPPQSGASAAIIRRL
jgi:hypothetical protein